MVSLDAVSQAQLGAGSSTGMRNVTKFLVIIKISRERFENCGCSSQLHSGIGGERYNGNRVLPAMCRLYMVDVTIAT